jgi:23S rRNA G2445 N2-methylase RlmL
MEGIYKVLGKKYNVEEASQLAEDDYDVVLHVSANQDMFDIYLDTALTPIHRRGYRLETAKAPLREDIAYALLYSSGWFPTFGSETPSLPSSSDLFVDPFCGAGTIALEAAGMAYNLPPGRLRPAPLTGTCLYNPQRWNELVAEGVGRSLKSIDCKFFASDRDEGAVKIARSNAERAGVADKISFERCAVSSLPYFQDPERAPRNIFLSTNPPFGKRVLTKGKKSQVDPLLPLYQTTAENIYKLAGQGCSVSIAILAQNPNLVHRTFHKGTLVETLKTNHGGLRVSGLFRVINKD